MGDSKDTMVTQRMRSRPVVVDVLPWTSERWAYSTADLRAKTREELTSLKLASDASVAQIRDQITNALAAGKGLRSAWARGAMSARKSYSGLSESIRLVLSERSQREKAANILASQTNERLFVRALAVELQNRYGREAQLDIFHVAGVVAAAESDKEK
jgi:hypothetical protein